MIRNCIKTNHRTIFRNHLWNRYYSKIPKKSDKSPSSVPERASGRKDVKRAEYIPQVSYQRVTYEYPPPPEPEPAKPTEARPWRRHLPFFIATASILWGLYMYHQVFGDDEETENHILSPEEFSTFKITFKEQISDDIQLIELSPKFGAYIDILRKQGTLWNGKKLWSIQVKQPQIQVVRNYTPLPLYYMQYLENGERKGLLKMLGHGEDEGRMVILVKKYEDGEVSRYLHDLPLGSDVSIRGPYFGYRYPFTPLDKAKEREPMEDVPSRMMPEFDTAANFPKPENIAFFAGGTGVAPILQSLLSKNPPKGNTNVYFSVRNRDEIPLKRFLLFLEKAGRAKFHYYVDNEDSFLTANDIPSPSHMHYSREEKTPIKGVEDEVVDGVKDAVKDEHELEVQKMVEQLKKEKGLDKKEEKKEQEIEIPPADNPRLKYNSVLDQVAANKSKYYDQANTLAIVCGPQGYINYMAGDPGLNKDQPIKGLLGSKGWTKKNCFRMDN